jgi:hypothetical protein
MLRTLLAAGALLGAAAPADAVVAPGLVAHPLDAVGRQREETDLPVVVGAVPTPDGGTVVALREPFRTAVLVRLRGDGSLDPTFGDGGRVRSALGEQQAFATGLVGRPDGGLLVPYGGVPGGPERVLGLTADGSVDRGYGVAGTATLPLTGSSALGALSGGALLAAGTGADGNARVVRVDADGALDPGFADGGVLRLPRLPYRLLGRADGSFAALAGDSATTTLQRFLADGTPDLAFHGGVPLALPARSSYALAPGPGPTTYVASSTTLARYTAAGEPDPGFASGRPILLSRPASGIATAGPPALVALPDGGVLAWWQTSAGPLLTRAAAPLRVQTVAPDGGAGPGRDVALPFGGGYAASDRAHGLPFGQNGFEPGVLLPRGAGGWLVAGTVGLIQGSGEGAGSSLGWLGAAGLTAAFGPAPSFGGTATNAALSAGVPRRLVFDGRLYGLRIPLQATGPGLVLVTVRAGGTTVARSVTRVWDARRQQGVVYLTKAGERLLRRTRLPQVVVTATFRNLVGQTAGAGAGGRLRPG